MQLKNQLKEYSKSVFVVGVGSKTKLGNLYWMIYMVHEM